jgi:hypothetical protein
VFSFWLNRDLRGGRRRHGLGGVDERHYRVSTRGRPSLAAALLAV